MLTFHVKIALVYTLFVFHCSSLTWNSITCFMLKSRVSSAEWIVEDGRWVCAIFVRQAQIRPFSLCCLELCCLEKLKSL